MRAEIEVVTPEIYEASSTQPNPVSETVRKGAEIYAKNGCVSCHDGRSPIGPSLTGIFNSTVTLQSGQHLRADENYLRRSILQPNAEVVKGYPSVMPTFQGQLSESQLLDLINYLKAKR